MVLSSKRVCGVVSHIACLCILGIGAYREGITEPIKYLMAIELVGTLALLGITQFGKFRINELANKEDNN